MNFQQIALHFKENKLRGRYITLKDIEPILSQHQYINDVHEIGRSVQDRIIYSYSVGSGVIRILMWSQMHGNESTTTKALFDFFNFLQSTHALAEEFLEKFTFCFIPMLNPDGAQVYSRENANFVDLNRDAKNLSQPESVILRSTYFEFKPDYCFNLHDQRTIYGVGNTGRSAIISFLAPSYNEKKEINETRNKALFILSQLHFTLSDIIPGQIARFDDNFNINCVGDTFQYLGTPTILFEAGHFATDYDREFPRELIFISFLIALNSINENVIVSNNIDEYLTIPQNKVNFNDLIYNNVNIFENGIKKKINFAIQYSEILFENKIKFVGYVVAIDNLKNYFGHVVIDCLDKLYSDSSYNIPKIGEIANFKLDGVMEFAEGIKI